MLRRLYNIIAAFVFLALVPVTSFAYGNLQGFCTDGNYSVSVPGATAPSANKFQRSFPSCTVTVYYAGTVNVATIYSDTTGTAKGNPFTASSSGQWSFYAAYGLYDVKFSGGGIASPFTLGGFSVLDATPGIISGAAHYMTQRVNANSQFNAVELQSQPANPGDSQGRISIISYSSITGNVEVARLQGLVEPTANGTGIQIGGTNFSIWARGNGLPLTRAYTTDAHTHFFGKNPNDDNTNEGSIIQPNSSGVYSASALVTSISGATCTTFLNAGYIYSCPVYNNILMIAADADDWVNIASGSGSAVAQGVLVNQTLANAGSFKQAYNHEIGFVSGTGDPKTSSLDTRLWRDNAVGRFAFGGGTQAYSLGIYETTSAAATTMPSTGANWSRLSINSNAGGPFQILADKNGASTSRGLNIGTSGANDLTFIVNGSAAWIMQQPGGALIPSTSAAIDFGSGSNLVRNAFFSGSVYVGNGAAATPTFSNTNFTTTGMYFAAGPVINWATSGTNVATLDQFGQLTLKYGSLILQVGGAGAIAVVSTGAGAPAGACNTGSLYLRNNGGAGSSLYVCETTAWVAK